MGRRAARRVAVVRDRVPGARPPLPRALLPPRPTKSTENSAADRGISGIEGAPGAAVVDAGVVHGRCGCRGRVIARRQILLPYFSQPPHANQPARKPRPRARPRALPGPRAARARGEAAHGGHRPAYVASDSSRPGRPPPHAQIQSHSSQYDRRPRARGRRVRRLPRAQAGGLPRRRRRRLAGRGQLRPRQHLSGGSGRVGWGWAGANAARVLEGTDYKCVVADFRAEVSNVSSVSFNAPPLPSPQPASNQPQGHNIAGWVRAGWRSGRGGRAATAARPRGRPPRRPSFCAPPAAGRAPTHRRGFGCARPNFKWGRRVSAGPRPGVGGDKEGKTLSRRPPVFCLDAKAAGGARRRGGAPSRATRNSYPLPPPPSPSAVQPPLVFPGSDGRV